MKNVSKFLTRLTLLLALTTVLFLQEGLAYVAHTVGVQTTTSSWPFHTFYHGARVQYLYFASELTANGVVAGPITGLGYNCITLADTPNLIDMVISMKNTTNTGLNMTFDNDLTPVWTGPSSPGYYFTVGWNTFTLSTPFIWDGTSNIQIQVCYGSSGWGLSTGNMVAVYPTGTANPPYGTLINYTDVIGAGCSLASAVSYSGNKPVIRLTQPEQGTLTGTVLDNYFGTGIVGANVASTAFSTNTAAGGVYTSAAAWEGTWNFTASKTTYFPQTKSTTVVKGATTTLNFSLAPNPATLQGVVTCAADGLPIKGAKIVIAGNVTYSLDGGLYTMNIFPIPSPTGVKFTKAGWNDTTTAAVTLASGVTTVLNMAMNETCNPASQPFTAALNTGATAVNLNWSLPVGNYELIYDDGIQDFSTVWGAGANMNAVKFTALNYPVKVVGGNVNIGLAADYPAGTTPGSLAPFTMQVYDASGPGGAPGVAVGSAVTVTPTSFGWNAFTIPNINITSGNFYLVMIQVGSPPAAARLGVDTTNNQLRSFSKYVSGAGSWLPAPGNFMIRAVVNGLGGPVDNIAAVTGYQVFRLQQGQEGDPTLWTSLAAVTGTSTTDPSWPSFADGAWRWAVKAHYTNNRWSTPIFSNVLGKNWTAAVTVNVTLSCDTLDIAGTKVTLHNILFDSTYTATLSTSHTVVFPTVWKGSYSLKVERFNFMAYNLSPTSILADKTYDVTLIQQKTPPSGMIVDPLTVIASWNKPINNWFGIDETWDSGDFATNGWTVQQDPTGLWDEWTVNTYAGNPAPTAEFYWDLITNYNLSMTSKSVHSAPGTRNLHLMYDILFSNFGAGYLSGLKVEILDGSTWKLLKTYVADSSSAGFSWTPEDINIDGYINKTFKVRFRAYGDDAILINYWDIDNIRIVGANEDITSCILAYNVYLTNMTTSNTILSGSTTETHYQFPASQVLYGTTYNACVKALYAGGESVESCDQFTSAFLCAPTVLTGIPIESTAYLTWKAPNCTPGHLVNFILDSQGNPNLGMSVSGAPAIEGLGNYFPIAAGTAGLMKSFTIKTFKTSTQTGAITYQMDMYDLAGHLMGSSATFIPKAVSGTGGWDTVSMPNVPFNGPFYGLLRYTIPNPAWAGCAVYIDTLVSVHHNNVDYYWEGDGTVLTYLFKETTTKGAFLIRATAFVYDKKKDMLLTGGVAPQGNANAPSGKPTLEVSSYDNVDHIVSAPADVPPLQQGYKIYRDGSLLTSIPGNSTLEYYDYNLPSGLYSYEVKAYYDVSPVAPGHDYSLPAGPVLVPINYGRALPFYEPWDNGTFAFNEWSVGSTNWTVNTGIGNPLPCADFAWQPVQAAPYSSSLTTPTLTAAPYNCGAIWLDFDFKLISQTNTSHENLAIEYKLNGTWITALTLTNDKSYGWTKHHIKLIGVMSKAFQVRFRANGVDSRDILHWYVDNVDVYAICTPPNSLTYTQSHNIVNLSWAAPNCTACTPAQYIFDGDVVTNGTSINAGYNIMMGNYFPIDAGTIGVIKSFDMYFSSTSSSSSQSCIIYIYDAAYNLIGQSAPFINGPAAAYPSGTWINVPIADIPYMGAFYALVDYAVTALPVKNYFVWDGVTTQVLPSGLGWTNYAGSFGSAVDLFGYAAPLTFLQRANVCVNDKGPNAGITTIDPTQLPVSKKGTTLTQAVNNSGANVNVKAAQPAVLPDAPAANGSLHGYNVYRTDLTGVPPFVKLNGALVTNTNLTNVIRLSDQGTYKYFVTAVFYDTITNAFLCESLGSDTVTVKFPAVGIVEIGSGQIVVYPNPATENVNVKSDYVINSIEVMNYVGQTVYRNSTVDGKLTQFSVSNMQAGIYFVKVATEQGTRTVKVTVTH